MCENHGYTEKRLVPGLAGEVTGAGRPMRWRKAEILAVKYSRKILQIWQDFTVKMLASLPEPQTLSSVGATKEFEGGTYKTWDPTEVQQIGIELVQVGIPQSVIDRLDALFEELADQLVANGNIYNPSVMRDMYLDTYREGLRKAGEDVYTAIDKAPRRLREYLRDNVSPVTIVNSEGMMIKNLMEKGFELIKENITIQFKGGAMNAIAFGVREGQSWQEIARAMNKQAGTGAGWHWKRLVRTEMAGTYDASSREQYEAMGITYVSLSVVSDACEICLGLRGYYVSGQQPELPWETHPNCRCRYIPYWNLPRGAKVVG
jgi:hypothetical protein